MKKNLFWLVSGIFLMVASCNKVDTEAEFQNEAVLKSGKMVMNFTAHLSGDQEVPARNTLAQGQAIFQLSKDGTELSYKLIVANLENVTASHIHIAPAGSNGGVVAFLYSSGLITGTTNGVLAEGVITDANLINSFAGKTIADLITEINAGNAYVNVHTTLYPGGEIRGQIK